MCLQCLTNAKTLSRDVVPGFALMQSTKDAARWPLGWFGLVKCNDPLLVFKGPLLQDPCAGYTEDQLDVMLSYPEGYDEYVAACEQLGTKLQLPASQGHELVQACIEQGYRAEEHGHLQWWLLNHLAKCVVNAPAKSDDEANLGH